MPQLDPLLVAMVSKNAQELLMQEGQPAALRIGGVLKPVSQKALDRSQIGRLLGELSDAVDGARIVAGQPAEFGYRLTDGTEFLCRVGASGPGIAARIVPAAVAPAEAPAEAPVEVAAAAAVPVSEENDDAPQVEITGAVVAVDIPAEGATLDDYLRAMVSIGASDLHLSSGEYPMVRQDGDMIRLEGTQPMTPAVMRAMADPIFAERNREEYEKTNDTDLGYEIGGLCRFRVNVFADRKGPGMVIRVIPSEILTAEQLGLPEAVLSLCKLPKGLVLVTGPTGSGKSTTLAAMIDHINRQRSDHIITIEDPVEFVHPNRSCLINQREVGTHTTGFKRALRAALREDPDIILVGEMRDLETIEIAIETAETGHLVFGTLHTTTAVSTVDRIIDQFPSDRQAQIRTMLSESIRGVVAQTLLKKNGGGRVAALEVLIVTPAISNLIREGKTFQIASLMQTGKKLGMTLLNDSLLSLVKAGTVAPEEAWRKAVDRASLESQFKAANIKFDP